MNKATWLKTVFSSRLIVSCLVQDYRAVFVIERMNWQLSMFVFVSLGLSYTSKYIICGERIIFFLAFLSLFLALFFEIS